MLDLIFNICSVVLITASLITVIVFVALFIKEHVGEKRIKGEMKGFDIKKSLLAFTNTNEGHNAGHEYVYLLKNGYFCSLKLGNHGNFSDERQLESFKKFRTDSISKGLKGAGDTYEQYIV